MAIVRWGVSALAAWLLSASAGAATHVLLIGVSAYPSLPEHRRLRSPANDVQLMRNALLRLGVAPSSVLLLVDGVAGSSGLPTRQAIVDGLSTFARQARAREWVIVYFSGHGSQQPQLPGRHAHTEPDGLDEIFLPYDIGQWSGETKAVQGALVDDAIGQALDAITRTGAHVWAIFDTCHAGDMAKGRTGGAWGDSASAVNRFVSPTALGIPRSAMEQAGASQASTQSLRQSKGQNRTANSPVIFYASQPDEPAAEEPLADLLAPELVALRGAGRQVPRRYFGLFTYVIAQALPNWHGNFRQLAQSVSEKYRTRPYPTPIFEGAIDITPNFSQ